MLRSSWRWWFYSQDYFANGSYHRLPEGLSWISRKGKRILGTASTELESTDLTTLTPLPS